MHHAFRFSPFHRPISSRRPSSSSRFFIPFASDEKSRGRESASKVFLPQQSALLPPSFKKKDVLPHARGAKFRVYTPFVTTGKFAQMTPLTDRGVLFVSRPGPTMPRIYPAPLIVTCFPHETFLSPISYSNCDEKNHRVTLRLEKAKVAVPPFLSVAPTDSTNIIRDSRTGEMVRVRFVN